MSRIYLPAVFCALSIGLFATLPFAHAACNIVGGKPYGDCAGVRVNESSKGHLAVRSYTSEGANIDGATVQKGGVLELSGISNENIVVH
jgi:hypothetical protein